MTFFDPNKETSIDVSKLMTCRGNMGERLGLGREASYVDIAQKLRDYTPQSQGDSRNALQMALDEAAVICDELGALPSGNPVPIPQVTLQKINNFSGTYSRVYEHTTIAGKDRDMISAIAPFSVLAIAIMQAQAWAGATTSRAAG